jgi:hypothetical protein
MRTIKLPHIKILQVVTERPISVGITGLDPYKILNNS